jgi:SOS-response transcriptional repressor LexA
MKRRLVVVASALALWAFARARGRGWFPVRVEGTSMLPTLHAGDLLAVRPLEPGEPRVGQLVVVRRGDIEIVKRVASITTLGSSVDEIWVVGDNAELSTDSRTTGPAARSDIEGVVRARYKPLRNARMFAP